MPDLPNAKVLLQTDGRGIVVEQNTYDRFGNMLTSIDKSGMKTTTVYGAAGKVMSTWRSTSGSDEKIDWTTNSYDVEGNLKSTATLDSAGAAVETTTKTLDCLAREIVSNSTAEQGSEKTTYDMAGNPTKVVSEGTTTGTTTTTEYDAAGQEVKSVNSLVPEAPTTTEYDAAGNEILVETPGEELETTEYDPEGNAVVETDGEVVDENEYDLDGNEIKQTEIAPEKPAIVTTNTYDLTGNLLSAKLGDQIASINSYNVRGELLVKTDFDGIQTLYSYDEAGNQLSEKIGSDAATTKAYDSASRITHQVNPDGTVVDYKYDGLSRIIEQKDSKGSDVLKDVVTTYDNADRVLKIVENISGYTQDFEYQNIGTGTSAQTITTKTTTFADGTTQESVLDGTRFDSASLAKDGETYSTRTTSFDAGGRPTAQQTGNSQSSLIYDSEGRLTTDTNLSAAGEETYRYDAEDSKLVASNYSKLAQSANYIYSADRTQLAQAKIGNTTTSYAFEKNIRRRYYLCLGWAKACLINRLCWSSH